MVRLAALVLILVAVTGPGLAEQAVLFEDGREMEVESLEWSGDTVYLTLEGGGRLALPAERIVRWEDLVSAAVAPEPAAAASTANPAAAWRRTAGDYADLIHAAAERHGLNPVLLVAMAQTESAFDPRAVSSEGACGLMQLMPGTADRFGVSDPFDATQNIEGGARYLSWLLERFDGRTDLALAGYNAGEGAVERHQGVPPFAETRNYVDRVLMRAERLAGPADAEFRPRIGKPAKNASDDFTF